MNFQHTSISEIDMSEFGKGQNLKPIWFWGKQQKNMPSFLNEARTHDYEPGIIEFRRYGEKINMKGRVSHFL